MAHFWMKAHVPFVLTRRERVKIILEYGLIQLRVGLCACVCGGFWGLFFFSFPVHPSLRLLSSSSARDETAKIG